MRLKIKDSWEELSQEEFISINELIDQCQRSAFGFEELRMRMVPLLINSVPLGKINSTYDNIREISKCINFFFEIDLNSEERKTAIELDRLIVKELPYGLKSYSFSLVNGCIKTDLSLDQCLVSAEYSNKYIMTRDPMFLDLTCSNLLKCSYFQVKTLPTPLKRGICMNFFGINNFIARRSKYSILFDSTLFDFLYYPNLISEFQTNLGEFLDQRLQIRLN